MKYICCNDKVQVSNLIGCNQSLGAVGLRNLPHKLPKCTWETLCQGLVHPWDWSGCCFGTLCQLIFFIIFLIFKIFQIPKQFNN